MKAFWLACPVFLTLFVVVASGQQPARIDDAALTRAGRTGDDWLTYGISQAETRFSPLTDINTTNVKNLNLAWSYDVGSGGGGQEATPIVANGIIYGITNWSIVFAVDARTGKEKWRWDPQVNQSAVRPEICCGVVNRGLAIYNGMVFAPVIDGRLQALDANTGRPVWEARVAYPQDHYTVTMAPRIAKGKVIIGASGGDRTTRGYFDAYDAATGQRAWRFYTVPGIHPRASRTRRCGKPPPRGTSRRNGGSTVAAARCGTGWPSILKRVSSTSAPGTRSRGRSCIAHRRTKTISTRPRSSRSMSTAVSSSGTTRSCRATTGTSTACSTLILADLQLGGRTRKVIMQANKNAFFYVIDRITGQFISAQPFSYVTWAKGIDQKTGRPIVNEAAYYGTDAILIQPGGGGAHNWSPMSFNPMSGLVYIPTSTNNSFSYAAEAEVRPAARTHDRHSAARASSSASSSTGDRTTAD